MIDNDNDKPFLYNEINYMDVEVPGRKQPAATLTTSGTGTMIIKKRNTKSYKTELKAMTKDRDAWRKAFKGVGIFFISYVITDILFAIFWN